MARLLLASFLILILKPNLIQCQDDVDNFKIKYNDKIAKPYDHLAKQAQLFVQKLTGTVQAAKNGVQSPKEAVIAKIEANESEMLKMRNDLNDQVAALNALKSEAAILKNEGDQIVLNLNKQKSGVETEISLAATQLATLKAESDSNDKILAEYEKAFSLIEADFNRTEIALRDANAAAEIERNKCVEQIWQPRLRWRQKRFDFGDVLKGFGNLLIEGATGTAGRLFENLITPNKKTGEEQILDSLEVGGRRMQTRVCEKYNRENIQKAEHNRGQKRVLLIEAKSRVDRKKAEMTKNNEEKIELENRIKAIDETIAKANAALQIIKPKLDAVNAIQSKLGEHQVNIASLANQLAASEKNIKLDMIGKGMKTVANAVSDLGPAVPGILTEEAKAELKKYVDKALID